MDDPETENDALKAAGRLIVFKKAEEVVAQVVVNIRESRAVCTNGDMSTRSEAKFARAKELLTTESRQFVTASKLFVKSATESEGQLMECLNHCVHMIDRIGELDSHTSITIFRITASHTPLLRPTREYVNKETIKCIFT